MHFISFETSTRVFSLAVNKDEKVLRYRNLKSDPVGARHDVPPLEDVILPLLDQILDSAGIKFSQLDGFAIALGPGSFTSLRVGLATVKAFAMSTGKPVVGIPTPDIIAHGVQNLPLSALPARLAEGPPRRTGGDYDEICVINDARRGKVYACLYGPRGKTLVRKSDYLLTSLDDILKKVHGKTLFVGDAVGLYRDSLSQFLSADEKWWYPQIKVMAALSYERFRNKQYDDAASLLPLYLYPQDCQVTTPTLSFPPPLKPGGRRLRAKREAPQGKRESKKGHQE